METFSGIAETAMAWKNRMSGIRRIFLFYLESGGSLRPEKGKKSDLEGKEGDQVAKGG
jgi:hypothetical protein